MFCLNIEQTIYLRSENGWTIDVQPVSPQNVVRTHYETSETPDDHNTGLLDNDESYDQLKGEHVRFVSYSEHT